MKIFRRIFDFCFANIFRILSVNIILKNSNCHKCGWRVRTEQAKRLSVETEDVRDNKKWLSAKGGFVSVEQLVIERLTDYECGVHTESALFSTILSLLLVEEIKDISIPDVYQVPLDFYWVRSG